MKVKIPLKRTLTIFLITFLVCGVLLFLCCMNLFIFSGPWSVAQYIIIAAYLALSIIFLIASIKGCYYLIEDKYFEVHKFGKIAQFDYLNVIYIDEAVSEKTKTISFMTKFDQNPRYLHFDKDNVLYNEMLKKCKSRMNKDEFCREHPGIRF